MSDPAMTISQMSDSFNITARTLRFYEAKKLLTPQRIGQKRLYYNRDRVRLKLIQRGKRFGYSLENIGHLLDLYYIGDQMQTQIKKTYELGLLRLSEMESQRDELNQTIDDFKEVMRQGKAQIKAFEKQDADKNA
ncbi:MAG: MerR family DNA-binding transcriptional regulator [Paracoccaceae bacterium]